MRTDGHMHFHEDENTLLEVIEQYNIHVMASFGEPQACERALKLLPHIDKIHITMGLHPWYANKSSFEDMFPYLEKADIIGEIGLDNVWCDVDLHLQKEVFEKQLQYASKTRKPVVLHTKGQEKEIVNFIKKYPNTYLVHWYSCMDYLEEYIRLGCYFTIGPDLNDPSLIQVAKKVDIDHLMVETDGLAAIEWAQHCKVTEKDYVNTLDQGVQFLADIKKKSIEDIQHKVNMNFFEFSHHNYDKKITII